MRFMILVKPDRSSEAGARPSKARPLFNDLHRCTAWVTLREKGSDEADQPRRGQRQGRFFFSRDTMVAPDFEAGLASLKAAVEA